MKKRILVLCLFCMTVGFAYSQNLDPQITGRIKTETVISRTGKISLIKAESLKKIWEPAYIHVISISPKANLKAFIRLEELLQKTPMLYNPGNTLVLCSNKYPEFIKEAAAGYKILQLSGVGSSDSMLIEGTITPLTKDDNEPEYDFKFVEEKTL